MSNDTPLADGAPSQGANFPQHEEALVRRWRDLGVYQESLKRRRASNKGTFVFYEGPPTANGVPHPGHCLTRAIKDLYPRYKTMKGYLCERKAGWDTHGLPVEVEVGKELVAAGLIAENSKEEIEKFGLEPFVHRCIENVFRYTSQWEELTERIGFWVDLKNAYVTYHKSFVESVWFALKNFFDRGLLYQGHKIVWWWAQGGTALSSGEVGQGYREVGDPSVFVRFPLLNDGSDERFANVDLLVWTTTPWTLPSNQFAAVHPDLEYSVVQMKTPEGEVDGNPVVLASALVETVAAKAKRTPEVLFAVSGKDLIGKRYVPPFDYYYKTLGERKGALKDGGEDYLAWRVCPALFVTTDSGTGLVHEAPAFGEVDYDLLVEQKARFVDGQGPDLICAVAPNGKFTDAAPDYEGRWVKDCDKDISRNLKERGILFHLEQYLHDYPFCWRAPNDPLVQYPRKSWFVKTTKFVDKMLANNAAINWYPEHIKDGRFGNFLATNVDWALSRERFWGTPLPVWVCEETGYQEAIGSYDELLAKPGVVGTDVWAAARDKAKAEKGDAWSEKDDDLWEHLKVHKPYIDAIVYDSPKAPGAKMRRVPEVIDCWFDSGSMPFAQLGYPRLEGSKERFEANFPADFISEAIDQTRGWFYSQLAISTLLFGDETSGVSSKAFPHPFKNCIVLGLMLAEWYENNADKNDVRLTEKEALEAFGKGKFVKRVGKMSKSLKNYRPPKEIFDKYGADALRWYFFANQAPWNSIVYSENAIKDSMPEFIIRLWNVVSFFNVYQKIDGFAPEKEIDLAAAKAAGSNLTPEILATAASYRPIAERAELDRWILSELNATVKTVDERMDAYDHFAACGQISAFVDSLSNWYVRRSRDRFWAGEESTTKADAYWTLYESLLTLSKLIAPFVPFLAERIWLQLTENFGDAALHSVHLCDYPIADEAAIDEALSKRMAQVREIVSLGRNARMASKLKVRQPLSGVEIVLGDADDVAAVSPYVALIEEELNVKSANFIERADQYVSYAVVPDFKKLGPKLGKLLPSVKKALAGVDGAAANAALAVSGTLRLTLDSGETIELTSEEVQVRLQAKEGFAAAQSADCVVVLATELTPELILEGRARELVRAIQDRRKELNCDYVDRVVVGLVSDSDEIRAAAETKADYVKGETLCVDLRFEALDGVEPTEVKVDGAAVAVYVKIAR